MMKIPENVNDFISKCSVAYAQYKKECFIVNTHDDAEECDSPIEMLFEIALQTTIAISNCRQEVYPENDGLIFTGISWAKQLHIGHYRIDFEMSIDKNHYEKFKKNNIYKIAIELDGHNFHDKSEPQRRYEKARDRYLQSAGYTVFHFTGAEIVKNPFSAVFECIHTLDEGVFIDTNETADAINCCEV